MNPSKPSWPPSLPEWPEYFSPERPKPSVDEHATRMVINMWATALLVAAVVVLVYLLARIV